MTQYNAQADSQDLVSLMNDLTGADDSSFPLKQKTRFANMTLKEIWSWIFSVYGGAQYDDANQTGEPNALVNVVAGTKAYGNPTGSLALKGLAWLDDSSNYVPLKPITLEQIQQRGYSLDSFQNTNGIPTWYLPYGNYVYIFPASQDSRTSGLKFYFDRGSMTFVSTDTTMTPGFASEFHEAVAVGAAMQYSEAKGLAGADTLRNKYNNIGNKSSFINRIKAYYQQRYAQMFPPKVKQQDEVIQYL
jgi:hypothetical protein